MKKEKKITLSFDQDLDQEISHQFPEIKDYRVISKSLDARGAPRGRKPKIHYILEWIGEDESFEDKNVCFSNLGHQFEKKPIIIGTGPAGLFAALRFVDYGIPCVLFERGDSSSQRMKSIAKYWRYGEINPESNVCYGEGGAGLYSDGKLITRVKSDHISYIMKRLVDFGAPEEIAYTSNPHLGSNKIRSIISKISDYLKKNNCEIHYNTRVSELIIENHQILGVQTQEGDCFYSDETILAIGHSPKEFFKYLNDKKVHLQPKDFAIGVRIEHPRQSIDQMQYGEFYKQIEETARYRLSYFDKEEKKGTYSFCMCPGGYVLSSGTQKNGIVVNGMSNFARSSPWSNSALVVSVHTATDIPGKSPLKGFEWIEAIEKKAYDYSKEYSDAKSLPAMYVSEFLANKISNKDLPKHSSPSHLFKANLHEILPGFICEHLEKGLRDFDRKIKGFIHSEAILIAPETRTSCPVSIVRDKDRLESISHKGLYPCGEGAGYAGGITSAAVDGVKAAEAIIKYKN